MVKFFDVSRMTSVKISAVNLLGQRATTQVFEMKNRLLIKCTFFNTLQSNLRKSKIWIFIGFVLLTDYEVLI